MTRKPQAIRERESRPAVAKEFLRHDGRGPRQMRAFKVERGVLPHAEGSAMVSMGRTRVLCAATIEDRVPGWLRGKNQGWVTAEYGMLPRATGERTPRTSQTGGRAQEIQRLIGRSLRSVTDLKAFGERTVILDCDVIEADGGTRTAAINGAFVALVDALSAAGAPFAADVLSDSIAAISVGLLDGVELLDLEYREDRDAEVDFNIVMTGSGQFVEVQGGGEEATFTRVQLDRLISLGEQGIRAVAAVQKAALGERWHWHS